MKAKEIIRAVVGYNHGEAVAEQVATLLREPTAEVNSWAMEHAKETLNELLQALASTHDLDELVEDLEELVERI